MNPVSNGAFKTSALAAAISLLLAQGVDAAPLQSMGQINPSGDSLNTSIFSPGRDYLLFWGIDGSNTFHGNPWRSDGTRSGTSLIKVISGSNAGNPGGFREVNGIQIFAFNDGLTGEQVWRTDGTAAGTFTLSSFATNQGPSNNFWMLGNSFDFSAPSGCSGGVDCMWTTDGTAMVSQILTTTGTFDLNPPNSIPALGGFIFFGRFSAGSTGLYWSDGTASNTYAITVPSGVAVNNPSVVAVNDKVYFTATDSQHGNELWVANIADLSASSLASLVFDTNPGAPSSSPQSLVRIDDAVFFTATDPTAGRELWKSVDGTFAERVADINQGILDSGIPAIASFKPSSGSAKAIFFADDGTHGKEPWVSDGTAAGTLLLADIAPGSSSSVISNNAYSFIGAADHFYMPAAATSLQSHVWVSDATPSGTAVVDSTVRATPQAADAGRLFAAGYGAAGQELFEMSLLDNEPRLDPQSVTWCARPELPIVDVNTVESTVSFPEYGGITKFSFLSLDIFHTYVGDLTVDLRHEETGINVTLLTANDLQNCAGRIIDIQLDDSASTPVGSCSDDRDAFPIGARMAPSNPLSALAGENLKGHWTLSVTDHAHADTGTLHQWCMSVGTDHIFYDGHE